jgi:hypothetical protein
MTAMQYLEHLITCMKLGCQTQITELVSLKQMLVDEENARTKEKQ